MVAGVSVARQELYLGLRERGPGGGQHRQGEERHGEAVTPRAGLRAHECRDVAVGAMGAPVCHRALETALPNGRHPGVQLSHRLLFGGHCKVNRNPLFFDTKLILARRKHQRLGWHANQWNLQEIS